MNRTRLFAAVIFLGTGLLPWAAAAQNLEAGKSPGQLFASNCSECHRSARGLLRSVPPGSLPGFLREHYTTSRDMAQQLSGFLISNGAVDPRAKQEVRDPRTGRPDPRQPPSAADPRQPVAPDPRQTRPAEPEQTRPQRPIEQEQAIRPQEEPPQAAPLPAPEPPRLSRREQRAKQREAQRAARTAAAERQAAAEREAARKEKKARTRITPARIDAASERGKQALPLGEAVKNEPAAEAPQAATPADVTQPEPPKPATPESAGARADPVPQVTPAPAVPPAGPPSAPAEKSSDAGAGSVPPPAAVTVPAPAAPQPASGGPPAPPISN